MLWDSAVLLQGLTPIHADFSVSAETIMATSNIMTMKLSKTLAKRSLACSRPSCVFNTKGKFSLAKAKLYSAASATKGKSTSENC